ncbi:hypothetical protein GF325_10265 [Candidatus Bathyarchaeota archaeon]|nr:hypothetical protein [Candidatus Bathyarchaeota archaeon]
MTHASRRPARAVVDNLARTKNSRVPCCLGSMAGNGSWQDGKVIKQEIKYQSGYAQEVWISITPRAFHGFGGLEN